MTRSPASTPYCETGSLRPSASATRSPSGSSRRSPDRLPGRTNEMLQDAAINPNSGGRLPLTTGQQTDPFTRLDAYVAAERGWLCSHPPRAPRRADAFLHGPFCPRMRGSFRGDSNQASAYPRLSGGQPSLETVPNTVGLSPSGALPSGHSRGVLVRFHGQGDRPVMAVTTGFQGRRFDAPEARTGVPRIDLPSPAPCAAADAVFADAKAFLSSNEARQMSESELERELHRRGQKLVRKLLQGHHDQRSPGQVAGPAEDASGVECSARREHDSHAETTSGTMQVVGLGCARRGHDGLHPLDAALNLLPERSLVDMRRRVTIATASRAPPRTPWKPQWYSTLSTWQRRMRRAVLVAQLIEGLSAFGPRPDGSRPAHGDTWLQLRRSSSRHGPPAH